ncbi:hypothetical protein AGMMS50268_39560 [Spirochaetia bacterium]|nr:hypothetical protein AGMMS50268_39560 [Spirochaetia bacterium]
MIRYNVVIGQNLLARFGMVHLPQTNYTFSEIASAAYIKRVANEKASSIDVQPGYPMPHEISKGIEPKPGQTDNTWCNVVSYRTDIALLGLKNVANLLSEGVNTKANMMGTNLAAHYQEITEPWMIQDLANKGLLGKISYINPKPEGHGHIGTVVSNYGTFIPALGPKVSQGGLANGEMWSAYSNAFGSNKLENSKYYLLEPNPYLDSGNNLTQKERYYSTRTNRYTLKF